MAESVSILNTQERINYLVPPVPPVLPWHDVPLVRATPESLQGYGCLVEDYHDFPIEIVTWPQPGRRPIDPGTGNEAGTTSGIFSFWWEGEVLFGKNSAVSDQYLIGWSKNPGEASREVCPTPVSDHLLLWHTNYHPDGGQLFFPLDGQPFVTALALPGDDVTPADFVAFYVDNGRGLYIHPNIWHEAVFPLHSPARFYDEQGRVHARVSCNFAAEFGVFLNVPLRSPDA